MIDFKKLTHSGIQNLTPYQPGKSIESLMQEQGLTDVIKLASNENPLGPSPKVLDYLAHCAHKNIHLYPTSRQHPLLDALSNKWAMPKDMFIIGNGSDALLVYLMIAFALHQKKPILTHEHAFSNYVIQAKTYGIDTIVVKDKADFSIDVDAIIKHTTQQVSLIFIANPNNPTGGYLDLSQILYILENIPKSTLLVLDEAYYEYVDAKLKLPVTDLLAKFQNLVITRTFSKAYGLAGLRLGYAIAHPDIIEILWRIQLPIAINQLVLEAGMIALEDTAFMDLVLQTNQQGKLQLQKGIDELGFSMLPATGNFITINCQEDGRLLYDFLLKQGIIVRPLHPYHMANWLRITIGTGAENKRLLSALSHYKEDYKQQC